jgi:hypothetical protein
VTRRRRHVPRTRARRGFTLLEAGLVTVIIGIGAVAILELLVVSTLSNYDGAERTTAIYLAGNIREITVGLRFEDPDAPDEWATAEAGVELYDDVKDLDGRTFDPPLGGNRQRLRGYAGWSQVVTVDTVSEDDLPAAGAKDPTAPVARVTVAVMHDGREVYRKSWLSVGQSR